MTGSREGSLWTIPLSAAATQLALTWNLSDDSDGYPMNSTRYHSTYRSPNQACRQRPEELPTTYFDCALSELVQLLSTTLHPGRTWPLLVAYIDNL